MLFYPCPRCWKVPMLAKGNLLVSLSHTIFSKCSDMASAECRFLQNQVSQLHLCYRQNWTCPIRLCGGSGPLRHGCFAEELDFYKDRRFGSGFVVSNIQHRSYKIHYSRHGIPGHCMYLDSVFMEKLHGELDAFPSVL